MSAAGTVREVAADPPGLVHRLPFRLDINALRALAVLAVVGFHARVTGFGGGFVGVDVFFAISGYLITAGLVGEATDSGTVSLRRFWARRVRRLVPALAMVVLLTLPAAMAFLSPPRWVAAGWDAVASMLYVSNFVFSAAETGYFVSQAPQSPYLHTWSLGVEEQFYLLWPVLILVAALIAARMRVPLRPLLGVMFGLVIVASALSAAYLATHGPSATFYLLPARAWEFAAAGLLVLLPAMRSDGRRGIGSALQVAGIAVIVASVVLLSPTSPGYTVVAPVFGTLLVLVGGGGRVPAFTSTVLAFRPIQWIGRLSYSWYLWHWPFIVLGGAALLNGSVVVAVIAGVASLLPAWASYRWVENPVRADRFLERSPRATFLLGACASLVVILVALTTTAVGHVAVNSASYRPFAATRAAVPDQECDRVGSVAGVETCEFGPSESDRTIILVGDSHAGAWKLALADAAEREGVRLVVRWANACPASPVEIDRAPLCGDFRADTARILAALQPAGVVIVQSDNYVGHILSDQGETLSAADELVEWGDAYGEMLDGFASAGVPVGVIVDNPALPYDPTECLTRALPAIGGCAPSREVADTFSGPYALVDADVLASRAAIPTYEPTLQICDSTECRLFDGDTVIFRDRDHLSRAWTGEQVSHLRALIGAVLAAPIDMADGVE